MSQRPAANRMTLQVYKARLGGATKGWKLLKKKRDALKARFYQLLKEIVETKVSAGQYLKDGSFALAKAQWAAAGDDISGNVVERAKVPSITCTLSGANVAGVSLPSFTVTHDKAKDASLDTLGVAHGGAVIQATRETYQRAMINLVKLASLQTSFVTLDEEIKMTSRRVNALEFVLIPRIEETMKYIEGEIDEQARDEFTRVKKVVEKKRQKIAKAKAEEAAALAAMEAAGSAVGEKDKDVVF